MSTFFEQFSKLPDNSATIYLKRIFFDKNILEKILTIREITNVQEDADKTFLYDTGEEMFMFISYKEFPNNKKIEFIDRKKYLNTKEIIVLRERINNESALLFYEEHHDFNLEFTITENWSNEDKLMISKEYVILNYGNIEKIILQKFTRKQINKKKPSEVSKSLYNIKELWMTSSWKMSRKNDLPAETTYSKNGKKISEKWYTNDMLDRKNGPAIIVYDQIGRIKKESWYIKDKRNNHSGPSEVFYRYADKKKVKVWFDNDEYIESREEIL